MKIEQTTVHESLKVDGKGAKVKESVLKTDKFPEGVQPGRVSIRAGRTLDLYRGSYEKASYGVEISMPFLPSQVEEAVQELEAMVESRVAAFVAARDAGKLAGTPATPPVSPASSPSAKRTNTISNEGKF